VEKISAPADANNCEFYSPGVAVASPAALAFKQILRRNLQFLSEVGFA
jgi:hypothetical protein